VEAVGSNLFLNGLRVADVGMKTVTATGPKPTLDEVQKIAGRRGGASGRGEDGEDGDKEAGEYDSDGERQRGKLPDLAKLVESLGASVASETTTLQPGDLVRMYRGDLKNVMGRVVEVRGSTFILAPDKVTAEALGSSDPLELSVKEAMKVFALSDHVKVGVGEYAGETGTVLALVPPEPDEPEDAVSADVMLDSGGGRHTRVPVKHLTKTTEIVRSVASIDVRGRGGVWGWQVRPRSSATCLLPLSALHRGTSCTTWWSCRGWGTRTGRRA